MGDETKAPKDLLSILRRIRPYGLALASVVLIALAAWGTLITFERFPQLSDWSVPLGIGAAAVIAFALLWKVPQWQVGKVSGLEPKERFDRVNEARKTLAQIIGGIAVLAGFYSTIQNIKVAQQSFALAQEGQITDRFSKAIEQLGAVDSNGKKKLEVRLGGIYALQRIANESEEEHWPIMEVLTAYVRANAPRRKQRAEAEWWLKPATDIQAILTVLGTRYAKSEHKNEILNLRTADMSGADLRGADLRGAYLWGADLHLAYLWGADLNHAVLMWADLRWAHFERADLSGADLTGAGLQRADLSGAALSGAALIGADLNGTKLDHADLREADLSGADLRGANLSGAHLATAKNLNQQQIDSAEGDSDTTLPSNLHMPDSWKSRPQ
jgi:uncharacterized protein YjbI with pentapeptide repeats